MAIPRVFEERFYRDWVEESDLQSFRVTVDETDLWICADVDLSVDARRAVEDYRSQITRYVKERPAFRSSLHPLGNDPRSPRIIRAMLQAGHRAGVGPFAAVAGAVAEFVGHVLLRRSREILVENGGDVFMKSHRTRRVGIFAGESPLSGRLALELLPSVTPAGVCTSSGTVGHSKSFGKADAAVVVARSTVLADAAATAVGNVVRRSEDLDRGIEQAKAIKGVQGVLIILGDRLAAWGDLRLLRAD